MQEKERENAKFLHFASKYAIFPRIVSREMDETFCEKRTKLI